MRSAYVRPAKGSYRCNSGSDHRRDNRSVGSDYHISKEQKVSEFRQQWIDALREDIAAAIRYGHSILRSSRKWEENSPEWESVYREDFAGVTEATARIRLRLNPKEKESIALIAAINKHMRAIESVKEPDFDAVSSAANDVVAAAPSGVEAGVDASPFW